MDLTFLVGNIAVVCTIAASFSGIPLILEFFQKKSTANASVLPFLASMTCTSLWLLYCTIMNDPLMQGLNLICSILQTIYVGCFYVNTVHKKKTLQMVGIAFTFLISTYLYGFHVADISTGSYTLGFLAAVGSILASAAPLASITQVFQTKSSESLPFLIIFSTFVVTFLWFIYGILIENSFVQVPNFISAVISAFQLGLIAVFPKKLQEKKTE
ncbi:unnamed protein product [Larinioides sclopetarius]|uniref:Sugar transporter SWEET1 n=1 Tax=Larinioides sclopetarius TaxID=280406 RepID=A0AAV2AXB8_9ARAC